MPTPIMKYFKQAEFREFWTLMDPRLLIVMDEFRELWDGLVIISPATGAIGRSDGEKSFHNYKIHGTVKAVDLMPKGMTNKGHFAHAVDCATRAGALGVGIYPDWMPQPGIHIDIGVRTGHSRGKPATWAGVKRNGKQVYIGLSEVL